MTSRSFRTSVIATAAALVTLTLPGLAVESAAASPGAAGHAAAASGRLTAGDAAQASALAASTGQPVEVLSDRTDWQQVFAEPGGGFSATESLVPQRVQEPDGSWTAVNTTLSVQPSGLVAPGAITTGLTLSDGGSGPLYTLSQGGTSLAVSWPFGSLPVPSLSGATATYSNVLPGVNLLVTALPTGVSDVVEVTSATAAANPDLAKITFPVSASGLSVAAAASGLVTASDGSGNAVFTASPPQMWDSAGQQAPGAQAQPASPAAAAAGAVPGDHSAVMRVSAGQHSVSLTPAASVLSGRGVVYPVFIDPSWNGTKDGGATWSDAFFDTNGSDSADWEFSSSQFGGIRVGAACDDTGCTTTTIKVRSFLNFPVPSDSTFANATYMDSQLQIDNTWSWTCNPPNGARTMYVYNTKNNTKTTQSSVSSMTWENQPGEGTLQDSKAFEHGNNCSSATVYLNTTKVAQQASANNWDHITLDLAASSTAESSYDEYSWKRFDASTMQLQFYWRNAPDKPTSPGTQATFDAQNGTTVTACSGSSSNPDWVNSNWTTWQANIDDKDRYSSNGTGGNLDGYFPWQNITAGNSGTLNADQDGSGGLAGGPPPAKAFTGTRSGSGGDEYWWNSYGTTIATTNRFNDNVPALGAPPNDKDSATCYFQIDQTAPGSAPTFSSTPQYTSGVATQLVGTQSKFTFTAGSMDTPIGGCTTTCPSSALVNDVVGFNYGIDNPNPSTYVPATVGASTSSASVTITPFSTTELDLYAQPVDRAGNVGPVSEFKIDTLSAPGNIDTLAWWKLNNNGVDSNVVSGTSGADLALSSGASFGCPGPVTASPAGYTCSMDVDGSSGRAFSARPVMGNDVSFSASAWVNPAACGTSSSPQYCAALSQGASNISAFTLGYQRYGTANGSGQACPCWIFAMPQQDVAGDEYSPSGSSSGWWVAAAPAGSGALNSWTQITGVFNASHNELLLYVNGGDGAQHPGDGQPGDGNTAATLLNVRAWSAPGTGVFRLGADWTNPSGVSTPQDFFNGAISDACVFYGVLNTGANGTNPDVQNLYAKGAGDGCAALHTTYP